VRAFDGYGKAKEDSHAQTSDERIDCGPACGLATPGGKLSGGEQQQLVIGAGELHQHAIASIGAAAIRPYRIRIPGIGPSAGLAACGGPNWRQEANFAESLSRPATPFRGARGRLYKLGLEPETANQ
jgi:hypothetical protein